MAEIVKFPEGTPEQAIIELESLIGAIGMQNKELGDMLFEAWEAVKEAWFL